MKVLVIPGYILDTLDDFGVSIKDIDNALSNGDDSINELLNKYMSKRNVDDILAISKSVIDYNAGMPFVNSNMFTSLQDRETKDDAIYYNDNIIINLGDNNLVGVNGQVRSDKMSNLREYFISNYVKVAYDIYKANILHELPSSLSRLYIHLKLKENNLL